MKLVFISGPYRANHYDGIEANIQRAGTAALELWGHSYAVICPHMNTAHFDDAGLSDEEALKGDLEILSRCDAIYMLRDWRMSAGAIAEHDAAVDWGLEIIYQL
jgi:hypothetical protein